MPETAKLQLDLTADGTGAWGAPTRANWQKIEDRLTKEQAGDPTGLVAGEYVGQRLYDSTNGFVWTCVTAGVAAAAVWAVYSQSLYVADAAALTALDPARYRRCLVYQVDTGVVHSSRFDGANWIWDSIAGTEPAAAPPAELGIPIGGVMPYAGTSDPAGDWLNKYFLCDGRAISKTTYAALWAAIGSAHVYGTDPGGNNFKIPDIRNRVVFCKGTDSEFNTLGETGGSKSHSHNTIGTDIQPGSSFAQPSSENHLNPYITLNYIIRAL
jgi:hypothetical protein